MVAALFVLSLALAAGSPPSIAAAQTQASELVGSYRLIETWGEQPWALSPGRFGHAVDISSTQRGETFVLDRRHQALHRMDLRLRFPSVVPLSWVQGGWEARRIDADDAVYVLSRRRDDARIDRVDDQGNVRPLFELAARYNDIAVHEGLVYLSRSYPRLPFTPPPRSRFSRDKGGVDVYDMSGQLLYELDPAPLYFPIGVDVGPDGVVYVVNRVPSPEPETTPGPIATPPPNLRALLGSASSQELLSLNQDPGDEPEPIPGIVIYGPDRAWIRTAYFNAAGDVAAGRAGVFLSRQAEIFALDDPEPVYSAPTGSVTFIYGDRDVFHLDVSKVLPRLQASLYHCEAQGVLSFDSQSLRPETPRMVGQLDRPELAGPTFPLRLDADSDLGLLQGRFSIGQGPDGPNYETSAQAVEPQVVQRWLGGRPVDQLGVCGGLQTPWHVDLSETWWGRDVAKDGAMTYLIDGYALHARPREGFAAWSFYPPVADGGATASQLKAVTAQHERIAIYDSATARVHVVGADGEALASWAPTGAEQVVDLAMVRAPEPVGFDEASVYVADAAGGAVLRYGLDGQPISRIALQDAPRAIAAGMQDDVYVLGRRGWAWHYDATGELLAYWRMPDVEADALDIAVDRLGNVFVPYLRSTRIGAVIERARTQLESAGIWRFRAVDAALPKPPSGPGCFARPEKWASPTSMLLGDTTLVRLRVRGSCPPTPQDAQLVLALDTSASMGWDAALDRGRLGIGRFLDLLAPGVADGQGLELGLTTFDDAGSVVAPGGSSLAALAAGLAGLEAFGDTRMGDGIRIAQSAFQGFPEPSSPETARNILLVSDAEYKDSISDAVAAARADGIGLHALIYPVASFSPSMAANLKRILGPEAKVLVEPDGAQLRDLVPRVGGPLPQPGLFETIEIIDEIPGNMRYLEGSARPPAEFDSATNRLTWILDGVSAAEGIDLRYRLEPLEAGRHPTNVEARALYRDASGADGDLLFPVPHVEVLVRDDLWARAYLPYASHQVCLKPETSLELVLVLDASRSMAAPSETGGTKLDAALQAAGLLIDKLDPRQDRAAIVSFNSEWQSIARLSSDRQALRAALESVQSAPGTRIDRGLEGGQSMLADARIGALKALVLLSDGLHAGDPATPRGIAAAMEQAGVLRYTIALGEDADEGLLAELASSEDSFYRSASTEDLEGIYLDIADRLGCR